MVATTDLNFLNEPVTSQKPTTRITTVAFTQEMKDDAETIAKYMIANPKFASKKTIENIKEYILKNWEDNETQRQKIRNLIAERNDYINTISYYKDLIEQIGKCLGTRAFRKEDGSLSNDIVPSSLPKIIKHDYDHIRKMVW